MDQLCNRPEFNHRKTAQWRGHRKLAIAALRAVRQSPPDFHRFRHRARVFRRAISKSGEFESEFWVACVGAQCGGDVVVSGESVDTDGQVSKDCHDTGCGADADLAGVFLVGGITDPMESVFDASVATGQPC